MIVAAVTWSYFAVRHPEMDVAWSKLRDRLLVEQAELWVLTHERVVEQGRGTPDTVAELLFIRPLDPNRNTTITYLMWRALGGDAHRVLAQGQQYTGGYPEVFVELFGAWGSLAASAVFASLMGLLLRLLILCVLDWRPLTLACAASLFYALAITYWGGMLNFILMWTFWIKGLGLVIAWWLDERGGRFWVSTEVSESQKRPAFLIALLPIAFGLAATLASLSLKPIYEASTVTEIGRVFRHGQDTPVERPDLVVRRLNERLVNRLGGRADKPEISVSARRLANSELVEIMARGRRPEDVRAALEQTLNELVHQHEALAQAAIADIRDRLATADRELWRIRTLVHELDRRLWGRGDGPPVASLPARDLKSLTELRIRLLDRLLKLEAESGEARALLARTTQARTGVVGSIRIEPTSSLRTRLVMTAVGVGFGAIVAVVAILLSYRGGTNGGRQKDAVRV